MLEIVLEIRDPVAQGIWWHRYLVAIHEGEVRISYSWDHIWGTKVEGIQLESNHTPHP
jgi:hypothetical protein